MLALESGRDCNIYPTNTFRQNWIQKSPLGKVFGYCCCTCALLTVTWNKRLLCIKYTGRFVMTAGVLVVTEGQAWVTGRIWVIYWWGWGCTTIVLQLWWTFYYKTRSGYTLTEEYDNPGGAQKARPAVCTSTCNFTCAYSVLYVGHLLFP